MTCRSSGLSRWIGARERVQIHRRGQVWTNVRPLPGAFLSSLQSRTPGKTRLTNDVEAGDVMGDAVSPGGGAAAIVKLSSATIENECPGAGRGALPDGLRRRWRVAIEGGAELVDRVPAKAILIGLAVRMDSGPSIQGSRCDRSSKRCGSKSYGDLTCNGARGAPIAGPKSRATSSGPCRAPNQIQTTALFGSIRAWRRDSPKQRSTKTGVN